MWVWRRLLVLGVGLAGWVAVGPSHTGRAFRPVPPIPSLTSTTVIAEPEMQVTTTTAVPEPPTTTTVPSTTPRPAAPPVGAPSQAWLDRLALCESGGENGWRTGWFGIEAGYPIGHLSYEEQVAWVVRILAVTGVRAWSSYPGCVGAPY